MKSRWHQLSSTCNGVPHAHHLLPNVLWPLGWCCVMICVLILAYPKAKFGPVHGKLVVAAICKHPRGKSEFYRVSIYLSSIHCPVPEYRLNISHEVICRLLLIVTRSGTPCRPGSSSWVLSWWRFAKFLCNSIYDPSEYEQFWETPCSHMQGDEIYRITVQLNHHYFFDALFSSVKHHY